MALGGRFHRAAASRWDKATEVGCTGKSNKGTDVQYWRTVTQRLAQKVTVTGLSTLLDTSGEVGHRPLAEIFG